MKPSGSKQPGYLCTGGDVDCRARKLGDESRGSDSANAAEAP